MMVTIDRLGRIVVPKPVRDALGLRAGTKLELVQEADGFRLVVETVDAVVMDRDGLPVIVSQRDVALSDADVDAMLDSRSS